MPTSLLYVQMARTIGTPIYNHFQETSYDKKAYLAHIKAYLKRLVAELPAARKDQFQAKAQEFVKKVVAKFDDYAFFTGESVWCPPSLCFIILTLFPFLTADGSRGYGCFEVLQGGWSYPLFCFLEGWHERGEILEDRINILLYTCKFCIKEEDGAKGG